MSLYRQFKSDENLEKTGVLLQYGFNSQNQPITIRIARAGGANAQFAKRADIKLKPYRRQLQTETMDAKAAERLMLEVFAETVVLGWENVEDENGDPLVFSKDNCIKLFTDLPDLWKDVQEQATKSALFRAEVREADAGN